MNQIWYFIGTVLITAVVTLFLTWTINNIYNYLLFRRLKKNIPTDKKELCDPGKPIQISEKEVEDNERTRLTEFREFEKLRYAETRKRVSEESINVNPGTPEPQGGGELSFTDDNGAREDKPGTTESIKLD